MSALASPGLWIDVAIAGLLIATLAVAWRLERRLAAWRADKEQLLELARDFGAAAERAERGVVQLKADGDRIARALEALVAKGGGLRDDLAFMIERAEPLADRLAATLRARAAAAPAVTAAPAPALAPIAAAPAPSVAPASAADPSEAERDLLKALAGLR